MRTKKYYLLKRNNPQILEAYLCEFEHSLRSKIEKRVKSTDALLLIEKTQNKDNSESYTNIWTIGEGCFILFEKYTKKRLTFDYTGLITVMHLKGNTLTWEQYDKNGCKF